MPPSATSRDSAKELRAAIRSGAFAPVYYFFGDDDYLKEQQVHELLGAAVDPATRDFNLDIRRGADLDAESFGSLLSTPPMMAERRVVVVRDVGGLKKDARVALDRYCKTPAPDLLLVLTSSAGAKAEKFSAPGITAIEFAPLSGARIPKWITYYAEHDLGCTITPEATALLQEAVGTELQQLRLELDKLAGYATTGVIDDAAVSAVVGVRRGETLGDLLDAVAQKDARTALLLMSHVMQQPKNGLVPIVMALTTQTLALAWARAQRDRGMSAGRLEGALFSFLKEGRSAMVGRAWGEAVKSWARSVDRWTAGELDAALELLLQADSAIKESRLSNDEQLLSNLILALTSQTSRRAA